MDLSNKLMSQPIFPPKSQIKRQKMIYHCKFGEFGVLEGQFTEPSGVAVNAQNDIIVADTNNHRIQVRTLHQGKFILTNGMPDTFFAIYNKILLWQMSLCGYVEIINSLARN